MDSKTLQNINEVIEYNPETGVFLRKKNSHRGQCGYKGSNGNIRMEVGREVYSGLKLAWIIVYGIEPSGRLKTIDGNNSNCNILNIAPVRKEHPWQREQRKKEARQYISDWKKNNKEKECANEYDQKTNLSSRNTERLAD